jgi:hypothetical protein
VDSPGLFSFAGLRLEVVEPVQRLTPEQCREQAEELRRLARNVRDPEHSAMLLLMAETWEQLAQSAARGPRT